MFPRDLAKHVGRILATVLVVGSGLLGTASLALWVRSHSYETSIYRAQVSGRALRSDWIGSARGRLVWSMDKHPPLAGAGPDRVEYRWSDRPLRSTPEWRYGIHRIDGGFTVLGFAVVHRARASKVIATETKACYVPYWLAATALWSPVILWTVRIWKRRRVARTRGFFLETGGHKGITSRA